MIRPTSIRALWLGLVLVAVFGSAGARAIDPRPAIILNESQGQSLAVGARGLPVIHATPPNPRCALMPNDLWGTRGAGELSEDPDSITGFVPAREREGPAPLATGLFGETHVTAELAQLCAWNPGGTYVGRSSGASGKAIGELGRGTRSYANALSDLRRFTAVAANRGAKLVVQGISFIHGEKDRQANTYPGDYVSRMNQLVAQTNADWRGITGQSQPIRYGILQLSTNATGKPSDIVQAQYDIALSPGANPLVDLIAPRYIFPPNSTVPQPPGDGLHLSAAGYAWMGEYIAKWRKQVFLDGIPWKPLYPTQIAFTSPRHDTIKVSLNVPKPPVVIDTKAPAQGVAANYGLNFVDDCGAVAIASGGVSVTGSSQLTIVLNGQSTCGHPRLQAAYSGIAFPSFTHFGAWTNIRDSDPTVSLSGNRLQNWLVSFDLPVKG